MLPHDWLAWQLTGELGHRPGRRVGHRVLVRRDRRVPARPPRDRRRGPRLGRGAPAGARSRSRVGHGRQHGRRARPRVAPGRRRDLPRHVGHRVRRQRHADRGRERRGRAGSRTRPVVILPLVCTLNATKVTDATSHLLGVDLQELDEMALATAPGSGGIVFLPVSRRRAHAEPSGRGRDHLGPPLRRGARAARPERVRRGGLRPARRARRAASRAGSPPMPAASSSSAVGRAAARTGRSWPTSRSGRSSSRPRTSSSRSARACRPRRGSRACRSRTSRTRGRSGWARPSIPWPTRRARPRCARPTRRCATPAEPTRPPVPRLPAPGACDATSNRLRGRRGSCRCPSRSGRARTSRAPAGASTG